MNKLKDYEAMKGITILLVVFAHVTRMFSHQGVVPISYSPVLEEVTNFIYIFHMPAFVAITGGVYYFVKRERGKYNDQLEFIKNKFKRLIIPFIFFSLIIVMPVMLYIGLLDSILWFLIKEVVLGAPNTHLWYSIMIFVTFVLFNFLEDKIYRTTERMNWFVFSMLNIFSFIIPNVFQAMNVLKYLIFFYAGYWFQKNRSNVNIKTDKSLIYSITATLVSYVILFHSPLQDITVVNKVVQLIGGLSGTFMLYIFSELFSKTDYYNNETFIEIKESSYGIYLLHPMIIYLISYWIQGTALNVYLVAILVFILATIISLLMTKIMRVLNLHIFIGESQPKELQTSETK